MSLRPGAGIRGCHGGAASRWVSVSARLAVAFVITAALLFFPCLWALWFVKSRRANLWLLVIMNLLLLFGAVGSELV